MFKSPKLHILAALFVLAATAVVGCTKPCGCPIPPITAESSTEDAATEESAEPGLALEEVTSPAQ